ncbi:unnamed protein product [Nippostrongylus brasiliensis]|uniref:Adenylate kinase isoenzyme 1 n=1 Tax=Nippostrongylus brasiliensis TaxID=27835 RepID=A0A158QWR3_NIPBR|nr:unnamed protein product [Nippostrongylus brasiliensis]
MERKKIDITPLKKANVPVFFIVGGPGSGKGTQCEKIVEKYGLSHLSSGDLLRDEVKSGSPRGAQLTKIMEAGELVPQDIVLDLVKEAMLKEVAKGSKGFLIDGYPREVNQGIQFEREIQEARSVIYFDVKEDILVQRLLNRAKTSGRADDNIETIKKRLKTFYNATAPVVDYYDKKKKLVRIPAQGTVDEIFKVVCQHLDKHVTAKKPDTSVVGSKKTIDLTPLKKAKVPIFFIVGGPGSGKGTQCEKIVAKYGLSHLSSGDLLRDEVKSGSPRGAQLTKIMEAGELVPQDVVLDLIKEAMLKAVAKGSKGFLIDGYPREVKQGQQFEQEIQEAHSVIFFDVPEDILVQRLLGRAKTSGRADDNMETIKKRLKTFNNATAPVVDYYEKKKKLVRINAKGTVDEIFAVVCQHLDKAMEKKVVLPRKQIDLAPLKKANVPIFFIVGGPGSGKGTQCEKIVAKYGLSHLSSGDLLRDEVKSGSPRGAQLTKIMEAGELVPMEVVLDLIKEAMLREVSKGTTGFLLDGYPREVKQGEQFEREIQEAKLVIFFDVSEDVLVERLLHRAKTSGRADDNIETIKKRLKTFSNATAPVVSYYEKKKKLVRINAKGSVDEIFTTVCQHLDKYIDKKATGLTLQRRTIDLAPLKKAHVPIFFIVGGPGSGKGTQCDKIVAKYGLSHLSSGDLLRDEVKSGSPRGAQLTKIMEAGALVPLEVVLDLVKEAMLKAVAKGSKGFLIDGYPREVKQGEQFESEIQEAKSVIFFDVSEDILVQRLLHRAKTRWSTDPLDKYRAEEREKGAAIARAFILFAATSPLAGRADDNMETIKKRLKTFTTSTAPVIDYYEKKKKLIRIKAQGTVDEIFAMVVKHLDVALATT